MIDDLWYKNAIIYCLDIEKYVDANGDGIGDFAGLTRRLDYLSGLGVTCIWLQPFYRSPNRDNGYDVADYCGVHPKLGSLGEFVDFMNHAEQIGLRVIVDLVVNHTSDRHHWFQSARKDPQSPYRDWDVWSKTRPPDYNKGMVFPGVQKETWTRDPVASFIVSTGSSPISAPRTRRSAHLASWASGSSSACGFGWTVRSSAGRAARPPADTIPAQMGTFSRRRRTGAAPSESDESLGIGDLVTPADAQLQNQRHHALATGVGAHQASGDEGTAAAAVVHSWVLSSSQTADTRSARCLPHSGPRKWLTSGIRAASADDERRSSPGELRSSSCPARCCGDEIGWATTCRCQARECYADAVVGRRNIGFSSAADRAGHLVNLRTNA